LAERNQKFGVSDWQKKKRKKWVLLDPSVATLVTVV